MIPLLKSHNHLIPILYQTKCRLRWPRYRFSTYVLCTPASPRPCRLDILSNEDLELMVSSRDFPSDTSDKNRLKLIEQQEFWQDISIFEAEDLPS